MEDALAIVRRFQAETPLVRSPILSRALGADVWLKNETVSRVASFKLRGALVALTRAFAGKPARRAVTSSTGNHGQGVACAAQLLGVDADVFVPSVSNPVKSAMIRAFGAKLHHAGEDLDAAKEFAKKFAAERGAVFVDDGESADLMEGAGTVGVEIARGLPRVDFVFVPMGSGTLASGCAAGVKATHPSARVIAVQAKGSPAMVLSFRARRAVEHPAATLADGLVCRVPAALALEGLLRFVDDAVTQTDDDLLSAMHTLAESAHLLSEPSGAAALAAAWERRDELAGRCVVLVVTGANATTQALRSALERPLLFPIDPP
jgi:threonine dehydratase